MASELVMIPKQKYERLLAVQSKEAHVTDVPREDTSRDDMTSTQSSKMHAYGTTQRPPGVIDSPTAVLSNELVKEPKSKRILSTSVKKGSDDTYAANPPHALVPHGELNGIPPLNTTHSMHHRTTMHRRHPRHENTVQDVPIQKQGVQQRLEPVHKSRSKQQTKKTLSHTRVARSWVTY